MSLPSKVAIIRWADANTTVGWVSHEDLEGPSLIVSIGFVVKETADAITITTSISGESDYADPLSIPTGWILDRKDFDFGKEAGKRNRPRNRPSKGTKKKRD